MTLRIPRGQLLKTLKEGPDAPSRRANAEITQMGFVVLYFLVCVGLVMTPKKLSLVADQIEFYQLFASVIGALVVGKVVFGRDLVRETRAGCNASTRVRAWPRRRLLRQSLWAGPSTVLNRSSRSCFRCLSTRAVVR